MHDYEWEEWRCSGFEAGQRHATRMAQAMFQEDLDWADEESLIATLSNSVRDQCAEFRARGVAEPLIQQYGAALIESLERRLRELATSHVWRQW